MNLKCLKIKVNNKQLHFWQNDPEMLKINLNVGTRVYDKIRQHISKAITELILVGGIEP